MVDLTSKNPLKICNGKILLEKFTSKILLIKSPSKIFTSPSKFYLHFQVCVFLGWGKHLKIVSFGLILASRVENTNICLPKHYYWAYLGHYFTKKKGYLGPGCPSYTIGGNFCKLFIFLELEPSSTMLVSTNTLNLTIKDRN